MEKEVFGSVTFSRKISFLVLMVLFTAFYFFTYSTPVLLHIGYYFAACPLADR